MHNFRYVTKREFLPVKKELIEIINKVQDIVRDNFTFRYDFIGSASRNAITIDEDNYNAVKLLRKSLTDEDYKIVLSGLKI